MPKVRFVIQCETQFGESVGLIGSDPALGGWQKDGFIPLQTEEGLYPTWQVTVDLPAGLTAEEGVCESSCGNLPRAILVVTNSVDSHLSWQYKYVVTRDQRVKKWELDGGHRNRKIEIPASGDGSARVEDEGGDSMNGTEQKSAEGQVIQQNDGVFDRLAGGGDSASGGREDGHHAAEGPGKAAAGPFDAKSVGGSLLRNVVEESNRSKSWRKRLHYVRRLFTDASFAQSAHFDADSNEQLAMLVVYLTFISSGQIPCAEDGSHYRPNHHAQEAQQIEEALSKVRNDKNAYLIRKIYPQLPSYRSEFTATVPLTRIRDIAHRNDIPHELKQEIKHTLQNKLHRSAGPEDLRTAENLLQRVTAPGANYSGAFVHQLQIFLKELREFFNAQSLDESLTELLEKKEPHAQTTPSLDRFLKLRRDKAPALEQLEAMIELRAKLAEGMEDLPLGEVLQRVRLADVQLEDFAFVLVAGVLNQELNWPLVLKTMKLVLRGVSLSGIHPEETRAIASELLPDVTHKEDLLRIKASLERTVRFTQDFSSNVSALFLEAAEKVGSAFHVDRHAVQVFAEADIRSNLVFQLSRLVSWGTHQVRSALNLPPWDVLLPGSAQGKLLLADSIDALSDAEMAEPNLVVVLRTAQGDEELPMNVRGVVLGHDLPHLSHLGVRARQAKVVFVTSENSKVFDELCTRASNLITENRTSSVLLRVELSGNVELAPVDAATRDGDKSSARDVEDGLKSKSIQVEEPDLSEREVLVPAKVTKSNGGTKAHSAGVLQKTAEDARSFQTPTSVVLPFALFLAAKEKGVAKKYDDLMKGFDALLSGEKIARAVELENLVLNSFVVEESFVKSVQKMFPTGAKLIVRSSANCEDLENMSGAGLYDSFANVSRDDSDALAQAIRKVWASLWTKRAALSRSQYRIPHEKALMAVLIQEMLPADYSFIMFSRNPISGSADEVYLEAAVGMGETLASAASRGTPYRLLYNRRSGDTKTLALASFSIALVPGNDPLGLSQQIVDYSTKQMTTSPSFRQDLAQKLGKIATTLETTLGSPQDMEGVLLDNVIYLVQSRPMVL